jgi:RimJ/RimL family protein N-acetyltransferase
MPFELQPTLSGELVTLRPLKPDDFAALYEVAADPLIWEQHPVSNRYEEPVFREFFNGALASGGAFVVLDRADGRIIGSSRYDLYDEAQSVIEIGWTFLARSHWGGRYNGEMKRLMLTHAFQFVHRVRFHAGVKNMRSRQAVERIGGVEVGTHTDPSGRKSVVYEITAASVGRRV